MDSLMASLSDKLQKKQAKASKTETVKVRTV